MDIVDIVLVVAVAGGVIGTILYRSFVGSRNRENLGGMIAALSEIPTDVVEGEQGDVAFCWSDKNQSLTFVSTLSGTTSEIAKDDLRSIDVLENDLLIQHEDDVHRKLSIGEEVTEAANRALPSHLRDKVERLEILVKTKSGIPIRGYSVPVVESEISVDKNYKVLRNEIITKVKAWRSAYGA